MRFRASIGGNLEAVRAGAMPFSRFVQRNEQSLQRQAIRLFKRYRLPGWVSVDDVSQALLFEIWRAIPQYDEESAGGRGLEWFVMVRATIYADKQLNKWRNSLRRSTRVPSRIDVPVADPTALLDVDALSGDSSMMGSVLLSEILDSLSDERDRIAAEALCACGGVQRDAAELLLETPAVVVAFGLENLQDARGMVSRAVSRMRAVA